MENYQYWKQQGDKESGKTDVTSWNCHEELACEQNLSCLDDFVDTAAVEQTDLIWKTTPGTEFVLENFMRKNDDIICMISNRFQISLANSGSCKNEKNASRGMSGNDEEGGPNKAERSTADNIDSLQGSITLSEEQLFDGYLWFMEKTMNLLKSENTILPHFPRLTEDYRTHSMMCWFDHLNNVEREAIAALAKTENKGSDVGSFPKDLDDIRPMESGSLSHIVASVLKMNLKLWSDADPGGGTKLEDHRYCRSCQFEKNDCPCIGGEGKINIESESDLSEEEKDFIKTLQSQKPIPDNDNSSSNWSFEE